MHNIVKTRSRPSVRDVYRRLVKYILTNKLTEGDPLPSHELLRKQLKVGNDTLSQAIQLLTHDGVLKTVRRIATAVADPSKASIHLWTIGIALTPEVSSFSSLLQATLSRTLNRYGCSDQTFIRPADDKWLAENEQPAAHFNGLEQAAAAGEVDAIISEENVSCKYVPVCRVSHHPTPFGVIYDNQSMVKDSLGVLNRRNSNHPLIILTGERQHGEIHPALPFACLEKGNHADHLRIHSKPQARQGVQIADWIMGLPKAARPDGIICTDDHLTVGLTAALLKEPGYRPPITSYSNKQLPLPFLLPVIRYEIDVEQLAETTVRVLTNGLLTDMKEATAKRFPLNRIEPDSILG